MATTPPMIGGSDPAILKSLEKQSPSIARTSPATISASTGAETSTGGSISRGIVPSVSKDTVTYNQATQATSGNSVTVTSSSSNDPADVVTVYTSPKAVSVSAVNQTVNSYKVNNYAGNEYSNNDVANYLPTYTGAVSAGNIYVDNNIFTDGMTATGLSSLTRLNVSTSANLGDVSNVKITGGESGYVLQTDGAGNLNWTAQTGGGGGGTPGGSNTQIQFNNSGTFAGNLGFTFNKTTGIFSSPFLAGNGNGLSNIQGANISGTVGLATFATTANAVAGANVSGFVANANIANTALSVAGANVSGAVSYATTANSVAAANVSGLGNIATISLTGSTSNVLYGNGVFAPVTGGGSTGDVTFDNQIVIGTGDSGGGGGLYLAPGDTELANLQYFRVRGGDVATHIHFDTGNNLYYDQYFGDDSKYVKLEGTGNIIVNPQQDGGPSAQWNFSYDGTTTLPNYTLLNPINEDLVLITQDQDNDGWGLYQVVTDGAGNTLSQTRLLRDRFTIETDYQGNGYQWSFDDSGRLNLPGNIQGIYGGNTSFYAYDDGDSGSVELKTISYINDTLGSNIRVTQSNATISTGNAAHTWTFDNTGNLQTPGDIVGPASANLTIFANAGVHEFIFGDDGTFYAPDNVVLGGSRISIGPGADNLADLTNAVFIASTTGEAYIQGVIENVSDNGSADWVALGHRGDDNGGWADLGFTSSGFNDTDYTITGPGDGYVFVETYSPGTIITGDTGGNLVLSTGSQGTVNDIIFGTGGFLTSNIFGRISDANNSFELSRAGATITLPSGGIISETGIPFGGLDGNTIALKPSGGINADQQLLVYPTAGEDFNHLHLTSGNLYNTELYLGNDELYVKLANTGNIVINTNDDAGNTAQWNFGYDGVLTFPRDGASSDPILRMYGGENPGIASIDASEAGPANLEITALNTVFGGYTSNTVTIHPDDGTISTSTDLVLSVPNGVPGAVTAITGSSGGWESNPSSDLATTGGSGTGLRVNVGNDGGYANNIDIATPGTGYTEGDTITVTSGSSNATFTISIVKNEWTFGTDGNVSVPGNTTIFTPIATGGAGGNNITIRAGSSDSFASNPGGNLDLIGGYGSFGDGGGPPGGDVNITSGASSDSHAGNVNITTTDSPWVFDYTGNLTLPTISLGESTDEQTVIRSQRKIIPSFRWSAEITGSTPNVVYTASSSNITSMKVTMQIQHSGLGMELFDIYATLAGPDTFYTVSNRVAPPTIDNSFILVSLNGSNEMQITVTIYSGAPTSWVTYDSTEFGIPQD
jgi:hypothetical protein